jgi:hypothetical protein
MASNVSRSIVRTVAGVTPIETATGPLLSHVLLEMRPAHGFKNVE